MTGKIKALGLVLTAMLATGALMAQAASAQGVFTTSDGEPREITVEETGEGANYLKAFGLKVECPGSYYTGSASNNSSTVELIPEVNQEACVAAGAFPATMEANGCIYVAHLGETEEEGGYGTEVDVACPEGNEITIPIFTNHVDVTEGSAMCVIHIKPQVALIGTRLIDTGSGHFDIVNELSGIHVLRTEGVTPHPLICPGPTTINSGIFSVDLTGAVSGFSTSD